MNAGEFCEVERGSWLRPRSTESRPHGSACMSANGVWCEVHNDYGELPFQAGAGDKVCVWAWMVCFLALVGRGARERARESLFQ